MQAADTRIGRDRARWVNGEDIALGYVKDSEGFKKIWLRRYSATSVILIRNGVVIAEYEGLPEVGERLNLPLHVKAEPTYAVIDNKYSLTVAHVSGDPWVNVKVEYFGDGELNIGDEQPFQDVIPEVN